MDQLQDDVHNLVGNQLGDNGLLAPVGKLASKEGINRAERNGKDDNGSYGGPVGGVTDPAVNGVKNVGSSMASGAQSVGSGVASGAQSVGNSVVGGAKSVGGFFQK